MFLQLEMDAIDIEEDDIFEEDGDSFVTAEDARGEPVQAAAARGPYSKISNEKYELIVSALERGDSAVQISRFFNVKVPTVYTIQRRYELTGRRDRLRRGGDRTSKLGNQHVQLLLDSLDANPLLTLKELRCKLEHSFDGLRVSEATLSRSLDKHLITLKCLGRDADVPVARNTPENKARRQAFAQWLLDLPPDCHLIYIDETGFNIWTRRSLGRSLRGQRVRRTLHTQRGVQVNVIQAISPGLGLVHHKILGQTLTANVFQVFIEELLDAVNNREEVDNADQFCIIMDGARFHNGVRLPQQNEANWQVVQLPPYSPFLNPTESAHSCLKATIKRQLSLPQVQLELDNPPPQTTLCEWRILVLQRIAEEATSEITPVKCGGWFRNALRFIPRCVAGEDIV